jgi:transposase-like protein
MKQPFVVRVCPHCTYPAEVEQRDVGVQRRYCPCCKKDLGLERMPRFNEDGTQTFTVVAGNY